MAYRDPYSDQYAGRYQTNPQFGDYDTDYNPYTNQRHHQYEAGPGASSYDNYGGYRDEPPSNAQGYNMPVQRHTSQKTYADPMARDEEFSTPPIPSKERNGFDAGGFASRPRGEKTASALRKYRTEFQGNLWAKGGGGRTALRFCCCTLMTAVFLFLAIVLSLALWIRPPNISINDVGLVSTGSPIQLAPDGSSLKINLGVNISVINPNYFDVNFRQLKAEIFYPLNNTPIGGGSQNNIVFESHSQKNFTFPFAIDYQRSLDPNNRILVDIASKCGIGTGRKSNINVNYKITLGLRIAVIPISPVVSNSFSFECPLDESTLESLAKSAGLDLSGLLSGGL